MNQRTLTLFTFLTSTSTLFCCALPALFVAIGFGSTFASLMAIAPQLIWFSENKTMVFILSGLLLLLGGYGQWRSRSAPCPTDPELRKLCLTSRKWGWRIYCTSLLLFITGFTFAYLLA